MKATEKLKKQEIQITDYRRYEKKERKVMIKKITVFIARSLATCGLLGMIGSIGAYEQSAISWTQTIIQTILFILAFLIFAEIAERLDKSK